MSDSKRETKGAEGGVIVVGDCVCEPVESDEWATHNPVKDVAARRGLPHVWCADHGWHNAGECPVEADVFVPTPVDFDTPADEVYQLALGLPVLDARIEYPRTDTASAVIECEGLTVCVAPYGDDPDSGWGASFDATGFDPVPVRVSGSDGAARVVSVVRRFLGLDPSL